MLTINRVEEGLCAFCGKQKEVAAVVMDAKKEVLLCWADVKKHAQMHMRMSGQQARPQASMPVAPALAKSS